MRSTKKSTIGIALIIFIVISVRFLYLIKIPISNVYYSYTTWLLALFLYIYSFKGRNRIHSKYPFIGKYFIYIFCAQTILCIYSMIRYGETPLDMFVSIGSQFMLLITYAILLSFEKDGMLFIMDAIFWIVFICIIAGLIHSIFYNITGIKLFYFIEAESKNNNLRFKITPLLGIYFPYVLYNILNKRKRILMSIALTLGLIALFFIGMTRAVEVAVIVSLIVVWIFMRGNTRKDIIKYVIFCVLIIVFLNSNIFTNILNVFSINPDVNSQSNSTEARYNAIEYFSQYTKSNPIMGMGYVVPRTDKLAEIWSGPTRTSFFDDLGFLGQFFRQGILGALIYIILIVRMIYITLSIRKGVREKALCAGITTYVLFTAVSLNCFDGQRVMAVPFYIACTEYVYYVQKRRYVLMNKEGIAINQEEKE